MDPLEILHPIREVKADGVTYTVRELPWKQHLALLRLVAAHAGGLLQSGGGINLTSETLTTIINGADELSEFLLRHAVQPELMGTTGSELPARVVLALIDAAVELNFTAEIVGAAKNVGSRVAQAFGMRRADAALPSPTTS